MVERSANVSEPQRPAPRIGPRVISSIEEAMVARRGPRVLTAGDTRPVDQLLHAMRTVKAARFSAASRFERKHTLSQFAMAIVSLYFVGLSVWQAVYAATIDEPTNRLLTLVSIMSSIFLLVLALIEAMNDYRIKAHHMHTCALAVNDLYHEFKINRPSDAAAVQEFRRRYNEVVRSCPINHSRVDYAMARAERGVPWTEKASARLQYACDVYALYGLSMAVPPIVLLLFR
ncbi:MAG: SLATT domain-containing protein [Hyphomicrobiaceae bacterium]|nr:MAG: SLATT domain-containing protein [Hyphomicrobiaceae bacterium]